MNAIEVDQIRSKKIEILNIIEKDPSSCKAFNLAETRTAALFGKIHPEELSAFQLNIAAIHKEAGCDLEKNHATFVAVNTI